MRLCFVDNILINHSRPHAMFDLQPHLGLLSLIAAAEADGHQAWLFDPKLELARGALTLAPPLYREMADAILGTSPDVVGFTSLGCNFVCTVKTAAYLKAKRPELPIVLGGPHATILDRPIVARYRQFDVVVRNEAELVLAPLLAGLQRDRLDDVPNVTFRVGEAIRANPSVPLLDDLDRLPWPGYHHYPVGDLGLTSLRVEAGRGCPFSCTFCSTASFFGRRYRLKSTARLLAELDRLEAEFGIRDFALTHDLFTVNRAKVLEFCEALQTRSYTWSCSARMDCVDDELLARMYQAGCRGIYFGVETGSPRMQRMTEKRQDLGLFAPRIETTQALGLRAVVSFITGYPQEEPPDQDATLDLIGSCFQGDAQTLSAQLHLLTPEPGTRLFHELGDRLEYDGYVTDFNFPTLEDDDAVLMARAPEIFMNHHYYPSAIPRDRLIFAVTAYEALHALGFPLLRVLIARYDNRLSRLIARLYEWSRHRGVAVCDLARALADFCADEVGEHWLTSLVRFTTAADAARRALRDGGGASAGTARLGRTGYGLRPGASVLRDVHDYPALLSALERRCGDIELARVASSGLGHYAFVIDDAATGRVRNFALSEPVARLLQYLGQGRSYAECLAHWTGLGQHRDTLRIHFSALCAAGIVRAPEPRGRRPRPSLDRVGP